MIDTSLPSWSLSDDGEAVIVKFPGTPGIEARLSARQLDEMLAVLRELRGAMKPQHPADFPFRQKVWAVIEPAWALEPDLMYGSSLLHIRDPGFGWLHYLLHKESADKLTRILRVQIDAPPPASGQRPS